MPLTQHFHWFIVGSCNNISSKPKVYFLRGAGYHLQSLDFISAGRMIKIPRFRRMLREADVGLQDKTANCTL